METLQKTVVALLERNRLAFDAGRLAKELISHPDYPALNAVTETLALLGIESAAVRVSFGDLAANGVPALVYLPGQDNPLVLLETVDSSRATVYDFHKRKRTVYTPGDFRSVWEGIALYTASGKGGSAGAVFRREQVFPLARLAAVVMLVAGLLLFFRSGRPLPAVYYAWFVLKGLGLGVCIALVRHELDLSGAALDKLCSLAPSFSCSAVLHSKAAKLFGLVRLADLGTVYFAGGIVLLMQAAWSDYAGALIPVLAVLALLSVAYVLFSLIYQQRVVKKWCPLCLSVLLVLLVEAAIAAFLFHTYSYAPPQPAIVLWCGWVFLAAAFAWYGLYRLVESRVRLGRKEIGYLRLVKNRRILQLWPASDPAPDIASLPLATGTPGSDAPLSVTAVLSLFCAPCGSVCRALLDLPREQVAVDFCLLPPTDRETDSAYRTTGYFYGIYLDKGEVVFREALSMWLYRADAAALRRRFPIPDAAWTAGIDRMKRQKAWAAAQQIVSTPSVWADGKKIPEVFLPDELFYLVQNLASAAGA